MAEPIRFTFHLETRAAPDRAFRAMSDTDSFNSLAKAGLNFQTVNGPEGPRIIGSVGKLGLTIRWEEKPFTFRSPHWFRIQRDFESGPASRMTARAQFEALPNGGTAIRYQLEVQPKNGLFRPVLNFDLKRSVEPHLRTALAAMVTFLDEQAADEFAEPVDARLLNPPPSLNATQARVLESRAQKLAPTALRERLLAFIRAAPLRDQYAMSALALAQAWAAPLSDVAGLFVAAVQVGLLGVRVDLLCPACLVPKASFSDGQAPLTTHCDTCNIKLDATFSESLAIHFFPAPDVRDLRPKIECFGSPARTPQVVAQDLVEPGGQTELAVPLTPGTYQLRTIPALGPPALLGVRELDTLMKTEFRLGNAIHPQLAKVHPSLASLLFHNDTKAPVTAILERVIPPRKVMSLGRMIVDFPELAELVPFSGFLSSLNVFEGAALCLRCKSEHDVPALRTKLAQARLVHISGCHVIGVYATAEACMTELAAGSPHWALAGMAWGQVLEGVIGKLQVPAGPAVDQAFAAMNSSVPGDASLTMANAQRFPGSPSGFARVEAGDLVHFSPLS
jgi:hypothetical protein